MEATREIYWNIGHGWTTLVPMYLLAIAAITMLAYGVLKRVKVYKQGKPISRTDQPGRRVHARFAVHHLGDRLCDRRGANGGDGTGYATHLLADRGPIGKLTTIDLEDEEAQSFGAVQLTDLSWKDIFDTDACMKCQPD